MNTYHLILHLLLLLSVVVLLRQTWHRFLYFLQMFQQHGYRGMEFRKWIFRHFYSRVILPEHFLVIVVIFSLLVLLSEKLTISAVTLVLTTYILFWFSGAARYRTGTAKKPLRFTARMKRLAATQAVMLGALIFVILDLSFTGRLMNTPVVIRDPSSLIFLVEPYFLLFGLVLADMSVPVFLFLAAWFTAPVEWVVRFGYKRKAKKKLASLPGLNVVAITGSYGKTSTKFMIRDLLSERYHVCATPGSYNTPMGICTVINNHLESSHQILVLEMGARYSGDIGELCSIARPDVGVITNVGKAHLETFGSSEAIALEKSVLARKVKPGGTLVLNADDPAVRSMASLNGDANPVLAGIDRGAVRAEEISWDERGTRFDLKIELEGEAPVSQKIELQLLGEHTVRNFLLATAVALRYGLRPETIAMAARRIRPVEHRLELKRRNGVTIIDDAFNSNPVGARHAVEILSSFKSGRRAIVTPGMIELGELQQQENRAFGRCIGEANLDLVILVGRMQTAPILEGIREAAPEIRVEVVDSLREGNELLAGWLREGDVVLYENDLPDSYDEAVSG